MAPTPIRRRTVLTGIAAGALGGIGVQGAAGDRGRGRYVVGTTGASGTRAAAARASEVAHELDFGDIGGAVAGQFPEEALRGLRRRPDVRYVERDVRAFAIGEILPDGIDRVDADVAHDNGATGSGADIAIVDTGIDADHPDLVANLGEGYSVYDCSGCVASWSDDNGHGTHCAGIADAEHNTQGVVGVSTEATLHAVKALDSSGNGYFSDVADGIRWVADQGYDVASLSLGASRGTSTVRDACQYASDSGVLLVAAAGNAGPCSDCVGYPAAYDTVLAVSAVDDADALADFSSTGPEVDLAAPGVGVLSTVPDDSYASYSGTSMACPHVSGAAGQVMATGLTNVEARQRLRASAEDIGLAADEQGNGLLDVEAALQSTTERSLAVSTGTASSVGETTATLSGSLDDLGGGSSATLAFEYRPVGATSTSTTGGQSVASTGAFSTAISGLDPGTDYEYRAVATASDGDTATGSFVAFTTDSATTGDTTPVVDSYRVTEAGSPDPHAEITADWTVSDADRDLASVTVEVVDSRGRVVDSAGTNVGGASASGSTTFKIKHVRNATFDVVVTVTDSRGNAASATQSVTE
ncbi:MAG: S8 family serine peptidase [Halorientalis sp.]